MASNAKITRSATANPTRSPPIASCCSACTPSCQALIHGRGDVDGTVTVDPFDRREPAAELDHGDLTERHLATVRCANPHVVEVPQRPPLVRGVAHHDPNVVTTALDPLGLLAVEGLSDLPPEILQRQPQRFCGRFDAELHLLLPCAE